MTEIQIRVNQTEDAEEVRAIRLIEDAICIILLIVLPDCILEKSGIYRAMQKIIDMRGESSDE